VDVARLKLAISAAIALLCAGFDPTRAQEPPRPSPAGCAEAGPNFIRLFDSSSCVRLGLDLTAEFTDDFARRDVYGEALRNEDGSVSVGYGTTPRGPDRHRPAGNLLVRPNFSLMMPTGYSPIWIHLRPSNTSVVDELTPAEIGPVLMDDAWASMGAFTIGRRFSFFDYNPGFSHKPGYASYRTTNVLAFTSPVSEGLTATLALEDGSHRRREDEVWALYRKDRLPDRLPDLVGAVHLERAWGNAHASFALHELTRVDALGCACPEGTKDIGVAGSLGVEYRQKFGETHGRIMLAGAAAEGALDYLGIPHFAPDYIADASGSITKTKGVSAIVSYEHVWLPNLRTSFSLSVYRTSSAADDLRWASKGYLGQFTVEFMPMPNVILGAELNHFLDAVKAEGALSEGPLEQAEIDRFLVYMRRFF
jgi:Porin subfamily